MSGAPAVPEADPCGVDAGGGSRSEGLSPSKSNVSRSVGKVSTKSSRILKSIKTFAAGYIFEAEQVIHTDSGGDIDIRERNPHRHHPNVSKNELSNNDDDRLSFLSPLIITDSNAFRKVWECILMFLLLYIGIIFPFKISFIDFRLHDPSDCSDEDLWDMVGMEWFIFVFFWIDLVLNFIFTYRDKDNAEIVAPSQIIVQYLRGYFMVNLLACLPEECFTPLINAMNINPGGCSYEGSANCAARLARLQRVTRLARLARLLRIVKIVSFLQKSAVLQLLKLLRSLRVLNLFICLSWVVHLLACGWYLVAALHENHLETWPNRRAVSVDGDTTLFSAKPFIQWVHSMYFILTVFTTVGFGDMYPMTVGEIAYVVFVMMLGAVVHSIIISEVINLISEVDEDTRWKRSQANLLDAYSCHTRLDRETRNRLTGWVSNLSMGKGTFDPEDMRKLLTGGIMPRALLGELPERLFDGQLVRNKLLTVCAISCTGGIMSPRFPLLLSTVLSQRMYEAEETVFELHDHAFNIFLVQSGTFAFVCEVTDAGAVDAAKEPDVLENDNHSPGIGKLRIWSKKSATTNLDNDMVDPAPTIPQRPMTPVASLGLDYYTAADGEKVTVVNPKESQRSYSNSGDNGSVYSALGQRRGAWTADLGKAFASGRREWLQINLGVVKTACGVCVQGHPTKDEWVTKLKVYSSFGGVGDWQEVLLVGEDPDFPDDRNTKVEFKFKAPVMTQFLRIEPRECLGRASMRVAVHVVQQRLFPYQVVGRNDYFGEDVIMGSNRTATVRCETGGLVMLLHKQDLDGKCGPGGAHLLDEFPQFRRVLRAECLRLRARRQRMLQYVSTGHRYQSFAAAWLQEAWRKAKQKRGTPPERSPTAPSVFSKEEYRGPTTRGDNAKVDKLITDLGALRTDVARKFGAVNSTLERLEKLVLSQQGSTPGAERLRKEPLDHPSTPRESTASI